MSLDTQRGCRSCGQRYDIRFGHECEDPQSSARMLGLVLVIVLLVVFWVVVALAIEAAI